MADDIFVGWNSFGKFRLAATVFYAKKDTAAFKVRQRSNFLGQAVRMDVVPLKLDTGILAVLE